ncbi:MAG: MerR family transcriptional regulator [Ilumatobacter coccineus]|uniref:MerR family transcriptional regulator n=1 Tax=Ilumatobacter coccineus TaxID=467094 RepID=A0A2G6KFR8_9ACTN|nr:MAG: MerR family transcriptional regulator [Ilumatobacter coccineus]
MASPSNQRYLSIGEVLSLLVAEFPDVTISKIRFLESQGLISPERTPSGYRKFYDEDVDLLRVILTEQQENYLPLKVIRNRLESGQIDPTGEHLRPAPWDQGNTDTTNEIIVPADVPDDRVAAHPSATQASTTSSPSAPTDGATTQLMPGVTLGRSEFCALVSMTDDELTRLEDYGVITPGDDHGYDAHAVAIAKPAVAFLRAGIEARHLRQWRTAAEREVSLYEQLIIPRLRHRDPRAREQAQAELRRLDGLGAELRSALTQHALANYFTR